MPTLRSWTDDESMRDFSGTATYEKRVTLPKDFPLEGSVVLTFGEGTPVPIPVHAPPAPNRPSAPVRQRAWIDSPIREAAIVYINGKRAGAVWAPPYRLDATGFMNPGDNTLRIVVGNLAVNHMAGRPLPSYRLLNLRYGERFTPQDMDNLQPLPSGMLGPVTLISR